jgi:hypothetical protein
MKYIALVVLSLYPVTPLMILSLAVGPKQLMSMTTSGQGSNTGNKAVQIVL